MPVSGVEVSKCLPRVSSRFAVSRRPPQGAPAASSSLDGGRGRRPRAEVASRAVGVLQRRPSVFALEVDRGAVREQEPDDAGGAAARRPVHRRLALVVHGGEVGAELPEQLDRLEALGLGADAPLEVEPHAGRRHQWRDRAVGRQVRIGAVGEQHAHRRRIAGPRGDQERRGPDERQRAPVVVEDAGAREALLDPRVRVGAGGQQRAREAQGIEVAGRGRRRPVEVRELVAPPANGVVQGRAARGGHLRIGAQRQQLGGQGIVAVQDGEHQRRVAVAVRLRRCPLPRPPGCARQRPRRPGLRTAAA